MRNSRKPAFLPVKRLRMRALLAATRLAERPAGKTCMFFVVKALLMPLEKRRDLRRPWQEKGTAFVERPGQLQ